MRLRSRAIELHILLCLAVCVFWAGGADAKARKEIVSFGEDPMIARAVTAPSYVLMDAESGRVLASRNMNQKRYPASTTKTMTGLIAIENGDLDGIVTIGKNPPKVGESSIYLQVGEQLPLRELVEGALIKSANDACVAIAENVAGSEKKFVAMMNARARALGATHTHFMNPHGLHHDNHYTTAYDLAVIARAAMKNAVFSEIVKMREATLRGPAKIGGIRKIRNRNKLLFRWSECDGVKTGTTKQAGSCLIASATRLDPATKRPWRLISVVLHAGDKWSDSANLLLHEGFQKFAPVVVARSDEKLADVEIEGAAPVAAMAAKEIRVPLLPAEESNIVTRVHSLERAAPIEKGQAVAWIEWDVDGRKIASAPLVAREAVGKSLVASLVPGASEARSWQPYLPLSVYALAAAGVLCLLAGWKIRANEIKRQNRRQAAGQDEKRARRLIG